MKLSELLKNLQGLIYSNKIMLAFSDEQKECYDEEIKSAQKELFNFPELTEDFKLNLFSTWVKFLEKHQHEEKNSLLNSIIYAELFDLLVNTATAVAELKLSDKYLTADANANRIFSLTGILNFCEESENLLPRILVLKAFLEYSIDLLSKDSNVNDESKQYIEFCKQKIAACADIAPKLKTVISFVEESKEDKKKKKVNLEKFTEWFYSNNEIARPSPIITTDSNEKNSPRNGPQ